MHLHFEKNTDTKCDCSILSLSWMGKVPDNIPADEGWKLSRINYYQEGWLATGNMRGTVGVTFTSSNQKKNAVAEFPQRTNFNLRGHRSEVILVKWNEPYQKLASCDSTGIIFVWIKYEGRWSIELINDRNCPVTHFSWSHDGRMALICYQDGFVLVGSVSGQRYWSSMLNLESTITCGIWTPDDQQVYFGTTQGQIIVMDVHGAMVSQVQVCADVGICSMAWSCEKFKMEEDEEMEPGVSNANKRSFVLAVSFTNGFIYLMKSFDDLAPIHLNTELNGSLGFHMEWSNSRELLAVAGTLGDTHMPQPPAFLSAGGSPLPSTSKSADSNPIFAPYFAATPNQTPFLLSTASSARPSPSSNPSAVSFANWLKFYTQAGQLLFAVQIPSGPHQHPVSALTWGHSDKRLFVATGAQIHIAWVSRRVASLQLMCRLQIQKCIGPESALSILPLPSKMKSLIGHLYAQTIRCSVPNAQSLREYVSRPPAGTRLHCTMIRHDEDQNASTGVCYTLYLEYLGGLVPMLKGKRTSKIRPEFVIFDPQADEFSVGCQNTGGSSGDKSSSNASTVSSSAKTDSSDSECDLEFCKSSPRPQRKRKTKTKCRHHSSGSSTGGNNGTGNGNVTAAQSTSLLTQGEADDELAYVDTLPEEVKLVEVNSNIWGTKFKIHGIAKNLPANLGQISYKTSLLHLQPRQMTVIVTELRDDLRHEPDPNFNPHIFSEDEDELVGRPQHLHTPYTAAATMSGPTSMDAARSTTYCEEVVLQPSTMNLTPRPNRLIPRANSPQNLNKSSGTMPLAHLAKAESYEDDSVASDSVEPPQPLPPPLRPISAPNGSQSRPPGPSYSSLVSQYSRSSSNSSGQSRHAISPLCSDGAVPTLQSPKNAVAPSDIIFDRPPPTGLHSLASDCPINIVQVRIGSGNSGDTKTHTGTTATPTTSAKKRHDLQYIDEDQAGGGAAVAAAATTAAVIEPIMHRTPTIISIAPTSIVRSCSVGYLDTVEIIPSDVSLSILRKEAPNKRLVLVDTKPSDNANPRGKMRRTRKRKPLVQCGKSKSLDSCDLLQVLVKPETVDTKRTLPMPKVHETSETDDSLSDIDVDHSDTGAGDAMGSEHDFLIYTPGTSGKSSSVKSPAKSGRAGHFCLKCRILARECRCKSGNKPPNEGADRKFAVRAKKEVTSFADSPLFTRKHRFGESSPTAAAGRSTERNGTAKRNEFSFSFLKQLSEGRRRKRDEQAGASREEREVQEQIDPDAGQTNERTYSTLHSQALSTLESIINRLKDLDDHSRSRNAETMTVIEVRQPHSTPASPAPSKKKRNPSSSPIRQILMNSPLLSRRNRKKQVIESSDEETPLYPGGGGGDDKLPLAGKKGKQSYQDLETFQKAQLRQKLKRGKIEPNGLPCVSQPAIMRREFVMHNKAPMWNENSQVYQLDFGGRVTQESAKNFQIEFRGQQVMQFGRIDGNAYTLDFQYPFSALQAFSVALANVTQRLK